MTALVRIGTRGSPLALAQAHELRDRLAAAHPDLAAPDAVAIVVIRTTGDRIQDRTLAEAGGKGLFTKEIEEALIAGTVDVAVHSMKDVPTFQPDGLELACYLPREDPRDALFARRGTSLDDLPEGAVVGTAGLRRQAQVLLRRSDLKVVPIRGNVQTRMAKMAAGEVDATLLALAGLRRLGLEGEATAILEPDVMLPAVAQGCIGLEIRTGDDRMRAILAPLDCAQSRLRVIAERSMLAVLDGSCRTPIAALAVLDGAGGLHLDGLVADPAGHSAVRTQRDGRATDAAAIGRDAGAELKAHLPAGYPAAG
jgi:hydroxymethylbilane synthase